MIKADILKLVEEEEVKLKNMVMEKAEEEIRSKVLTYEEYYGLNLKKETQGVKDSKTMIGSSRKDKKYEDFL